VIGGGVIGLSIAWRSATRGLSVAVVDPRPGKGASWAAAGMLAPAGEAHFGETALTALNLEAARAWPRFARELEESSGRSVDYLAAGSLLVAVDASDRVATDDLLGFHVELGLAARRLSARECRKLEPLLSPGVRGGTEFADDHQVDNRRVVEALLAAGRSEGVSFLEDEVTGVEIDGGRVAGVVLRSAGRRPAGAVVVAAGCRSGQLDGVPAWVLPPVRPVKGMTLRLQGPTHGPGLRRTVRGLVHGRNCYLVPRRDGSVVVGATVEEKGYDLTVQVGAIGDLLDDARRLVPSLDEYALVDTTTGLRPGSPDNAPMVGATGVDGLIVATGHYRNGILLAPITAREVVWLLTDGSDPAALVPPSPFAPFAPGRFAIGHAGAGRGRQTGEVGRGRQTGAALSRTLR